MEQEVSLFTLKCPDFINRERIKPLGVYCYCKIINSGLVGVMKMKMKKSYHPEVEYFPTAQHQVSSYSSYIVPQLFANNYNFLTY